MENQHENLPLIEDNSESEHGESKSCCLSSVSLSSEEGQAGNGRPSRYASTRLNQGQKNR